jgi:hypothetical protein
MYTAKVGTALNCVFGWLPPGLSRNATQPEPQDEILAQMDSRVGKRRHQVVLKTLGF